MSKYSVGVYGVSKYGEREVSRTFYEANLQAWSYGFNSVSLLWSSITTDPDDPDATHWRLVRSFSGIPDNPFEADFLLGDTFTAFKNSYVDTNIATENREVNYSIWIFNGENWVLCGTRDIIIVQETETLRKVVNWLPRAWTNSENGVGDATGEYEPLNDLVRFLKGLTFIYDKLDAELDIIQSTASLKNTHSSLLPFMMNELGFNYEPALGDTYHRILYKAGNQINSTKGTIPSIKSYVTGLTHLNNTIKVGHNLMLDYNDSSFEESSGRWSVSRGSIQSVTYADTAVSLGTAITPPTLPLYDVLFPPRTAGLGVLTIPEGFIQPLTMRLPVITNSALLYGIPIKGNTRYVFSGYVRDLGTSATVSVAISWYNSIGELLSTTSSSSPQTTTSSWKEFTSKNTVGRDGQLSPSDASFAVIQFTINPSVITSYKILFDMFQLAEASVSLEFEDAKRVRVYLEGERQNILPNPSFEEGSTGWTVSDNASFAQDPTVYAVGIVSGSHIGELTVLSSGPTWISSDWFPVEPGITYTFSIYLSSHYPNFGRAVVRMEFSNRESVEKQIEILSDDNGQYYSNNTYYIDSDVATLTAHTVDDGTGNPILDLLDPSNPPQYVPDIQRVSVTGIAPAYTRDSGTPLAKVSVYFLDENVPGDTVYMDAAVFQVATEPKEYFDGSGAPTPENPVTDYFFKDADCFWEYKNIYNFVSNGSFETTDEWTANSGTTFSLDTQGNAVERLTLPNGTLDNNPAHLVPYVYTPKFGTKMGKVAYNPANGGSIYTNVYLASPAIGGEDMVVSAYFRAAEGRYYITTEGSGVTTTNSISVLQHDQYQWIRISAIRQLIQGETSFKLTIGINPPAPFYPGGPAGYTLGPTSFFHIDGVQAEYGRVAGRYLDTSITGVSKIQNPANINTFLTLGQVPSNHGGRSSYIANYPLKYDRLKNSLGLVMPSGSTWCLKPGIPTEDYPDLKESLIKSASFEKDLGYWVGNNSNLNRVISRGTLSGDHVTHGAAYCRVSTKGTNNSTKVFGIHSENISVYAGHGYYCSLALRPENSNSTGQYKIRVDYYAVGGTEVKVYYGQIDGNYQFSPVTNVFDGGVYTDRTDEFRQKIITISNTDRWTFANIIMPAYTTENVSYAVLTVTYTPDTFNASQAFHIDRVVFRE